MPIDAHLITFLTLVTGLTLIPGATTMLVIRRALLGGSRASLATIAGGSLGVFVHATVAAFGLSVIFQYNEGIRVMVRWLGAGYLIWLGLRSLWRAWRGDNRFAVNPQTAMPVTLPPLLPAFLEGLITILLSPETALFYLSSLSQFILPGEPVLGKVLLLASIHAIVRIGWYSLIAAATSRMYRLLIQPFIQRSLEGLTGGLLILFALRTATSRR